LFKLKEKELAQQIANLQQQKKDQQAELEARIQKMSEDFNAELQQAEKLRKKELDDCLE
jgi:hypothetical protein